MKPSEIVQKALGKSLLIGAGVFIGMPVMAYILFDHEALISEPLDLIVFPVFYAIYISIQLVLSGLFFYLIKKWASNLSEPISPPTVLQSFLVTEFFLYCAVFACFSPLMYIAIEVALVVLIFSIPYIVCCTVSVFITHRLYIDHRNGCDAEDKIIIHEQAE